MLPLNLLSGVYEYKALTGYLSKDNIILGETQSIISIRELHEAIISDNISLDDLLNNRRDVYHGDYFCHLCGCKIHEFYKVYDKRFHIDCLILGFKIIQSNNTSTLTLKEFNNTTTLKICGIHNKSHYKIVILCDGRIIESCRFYLNLPRYMNLHRNIYDSIHAITNKPIDNNEYLLCRECNNYCQITYFILDNYCSSCAENYIRFKSDLIRKFLYTSYLVPISDLYCLIINRVILIYKVLYD